ncbi:hypothetical protein GF406_07575 [candidate division KSB1 bacterium]|nr:hypothetical protein [candidate division KSB1 bacterium]
MNLTHIHHSPRIWLWAILLLATVLRVYQIDFGAPYFYHPDEIKLVAQAGRLLETKFMDPEAHFGINVYPPFYTYILAGAMAVYILGSLVTGHFESLSQLPLIYEQNPFQFFLLGRLLVALFGVLTVYMTYRLGKQLFSPKIGWVAAFLLSVNFVHVRNSHFNTVDVPATFLGVLCLYLISLLLARDEIKLYIAAAVTMAVATATKFSMLTLPLPLLVAHFSRYPVNTWVRKIFDKRIAVTVLVGLVAFLIACPLLWLDFQETFGGILGTKRFEQVGKIGSGGGFLSYWTGDHAPGFGAFYPNAIPTTFGLVLTLLTVLGIVYHGWKHRKADLLLLVFIIPSYWMFETMSIKAMRHVLPLVPFFMISAAVAWDFISRPLGKNAKRIFTVLIIGWIAVSNIQSSLWYFNELSARDPRTLAREWILENIPDNSVLAIESFPPPLPGKKEDESTKDKTFELIDVDLTKRQIHIKNELIGQIHKSNAEYYISDGFTRQTLQWQETQERYPELVQDRQQFFDWLQKNSTVVKRFVPGEEKIQPKITIYRLELTP